MGSARDLTGHGIDDRVMGVTGDGGSVTSVEIDVLVPVDVPDMASCTMIKPYRLRVSDLPTRRGPAGEHGSRASADVGSDRLAVDEDVAFGRYRLVECR
ncbi:MULTISPECIES: hypothetical protein [unclassified Gordonia (in: high G+C Gram-positive bacteria)]